MGGKGKGGTGKMEPHGKHELPRGRRWQGMGALIRELRRG